MKEPSPERRGLTLIEAYRLVWLGGDPTARGDAVDTLSCRAIQLARRLRVPPDLEITREDLVQTVMTRWVRRPGAAEPRAVKASELDTPPGATSDLPQTDDQVEALLWTSLQNALRDEIRRAQRRPRAGAPLDDAVSPVGPDGALRAWETVDALNRACRIILTELIERAEQDLRGDHRRMLRETVGWMMTIEFRGALPDSVTRATFADWVASERRIDEEASEATIRERLQTRGYRALIRLWLAKEEWAHRDPPPNSELVELVEKVLRVLPEALSDRPTPRARRER